MFKRMQEGVEKKLFAHKVDDAWVYIKQVM